MGICRSSSTSTIFAKLVNPLLCLVMVLALLYVGQEILKPLAFSMLVALLLLSPCKFFEKQGFPRGLSAMISLTLALLVFIVIFYIFYNSIISFRSDLPQVMRNIDQSILQLES